MKKYIGKIIGFSFLLFFAILIIIIMNREVVHPFDDEETDPRFFRPDLPLLNTEDLPDAPNENNLNGMRLVASNDKYELFLCLDTTDIALRQIDSGVVIHSNPQRGNEGLNLNEGQIPANVSLLEVVTTSLGGSIRIYTSHQDSVALEQFLFMERDNGVHISFTLGRDETSRLLPPVLREETYEHIMSQLEGDDLAIFRQLYRFIRTDRIPSEERSTILERFPEIENESMYILRNIGRFDRNFLERILTEIGFTIEEMIEEMEYAGFEFENRDIIFTVGLDLIIDEKGLTASVDLDGLVTIEGHRVTDISVLRGFGSTTSDDGFIFLPDGSGIVMNLSSQTNVTISRPIFGQDPSTGSWLSTTAPSAQAVIPVFGIRTDSHALFAIIEEGAAITNVTARTRTRLQPVANVHVDIIANTVDYIDNRGLRTMPTNVVMSTEPPVAKITVRYFILQNNNDFNFVDFATFYRDYLMDNGVLTRSQAETTPFYVEFPGAFARRVSMAGIPVKRRLSLTSFEEAELILKHLVDNGVDGIKARYIGWANGGLWNQPFDDVSLISSMGRERDLNNLLTYADANGIEFFFDIPVDLVAETRFLHDFNHRLDAARRLDRFIAVTGPIDISQQIMTTTHIILSPHTTLRYWNSFIEGFNKNARISLGNMGAKLPSDFRVDDVTTRERTELIYKDIFQSALDSTGSIMVETGNIYSWPYTSDIIGLPSAGSNFIGQGTSVPFVQMVLHGSINYAYTPLNISVDMDFDILRAVETGAGLYVQMMYAEDRIFVDTFFETMFFSLNYEHRINEYITAYRRVAGALNHISNAIMIDHEVPMPGVAVVRYDNGVTIYVNYNRNDVLIEDVHINARDFTVLGV